MDTVTQIRPAAQTVLRELGIVPPPADRVQPTKSRRPQLTLIQGGKLPEGGRNNALIRLTGQLRRLGADQGAIKAALHAANPCLFDSPLPDAEVDAIAKSAASYPQGNPNEADLRLHDAGNARRLVEHFGSELRYVPEWKKWLVWTGTHWRIDSSGQVIEYAKKTAKLILAEAGGLTDLKRRELLEKHARGSHQNARLTAMVELAKSDPAIVVSSADLDRDDELLTVRNGTVNLRTGKLRKHSPEDLITRIAPIDYDPKAKAPTWWRFLNRVTKNDRELARYLQRLAGYSLTGSTQEQVLFFLYGSGANGKSTFLNVLRDLMGPDYAKQTPYETLTFKKNGRSATNDLARLQGARVMMTSEIEDGSQLDESLVKQLTGGESISARYLYAEYFEFIPKFKILMAGNHKPIIRGDDDGIWRRLHLVPFTETIPLAERDPHLLDKLRAELPGILNWAIKGGAVWRRKGLRPPKVVTDAVAEYREDSDIIGQWVQDCCTTLPTDSTSAADAYNSYQLWAFKNGFHRMSSKRFGQKLGERFNRTHGRNGNIYTGLAVIPAHSPVQLVGLP